MLKGPFISRAGLIENLRNHLLAGRSAAMVGGPMIGKTTLAQNLTDRILEKDACPIVVGLKAVSSPAALWSVVMEAILAQWIGPDQKNPYRKNPTSLPELMTQLHHVYEKLPPEIAGRPLILLLDDCDALLSLPDRPVSQIVNLALESVAPSIHSICWIGGPAWEGWLAANPGELKSPIRLYPLSVVPIREARAILQERLGGESKEAVGRAWHETGGHPVLMERLFDRLDEAVVEQLSERLALEIDLQDEAVLAQLDPAGKWTMLIDLTDSSGERPTKQRLDRLCMLGLTIRTLTEGTAAIRLTSPLFAKVRRNDHAPL